MMGWDGKGERRGTVTDSSFDWGWQGLLQSQASISEGDGERGRNHITIRRDNQKTRELLTLCNVLFPNQKSTEVETIAMAMSLYSA